MSQNKSMYTMKWATINNQAQGELNTFRFSGFKFIQCRIKQILYWYKTILVPHKYIKSV